VAGGWPFSENESAGDEGDGRDQPVASLHGFDEIHLPAPSRTVLSI
jgi:hypothetical protein